MKPWSPDEPARRPEYRKFYQEMRKFNERIANQDSCITFLLIELRAVQKRLEKLEAWRARTVAENTPLGESISGLGQPADLHQRQS